MYIFVSFNAKLAGIDQRFLGDELMVISENLFIIW